MKNLFTIRLFLFFAVMTFTTATFAQTVVTNESALNAALAGTADPIYIRGTINITSPIYVNRDVDLIGRNNAKLNGNGSVELMYINPGVVATITNIELADGSSSSLAGAITNYGTLTVIGSTFTGNLNTVSNPGAIYNDNNGVLIIENSLFTGNSANDAGAINNIGTMTLLNCEFIGNSATNRCGAVSNFGGATIINCLFADNTAPGGGSDLYCSDALYAGSYLHLIGCTFAGNTSGAIFYYAYNGSGSVLFANCILGQAAASDWIFEAFTPTYTRNDIVLINTLSEFPAGSLGVNSSNSGNIEGVSPLFNDPSTGDYTLQVSSPAIDAGNDTYATAPTDLTGHVRIGGAHVDIGAFEYYTPPVVILPVPEIKTYIFPTRNPNYDRLAPVPFEGQAATATLTGSGHFVIVGTANGGNTILIRPADGLPVGTYTAMLTVTTTTGEYIQYALIFTVEEFFAPKLARIVKLHSIEGAKTTPDPGLYYVNSGGMFNFTIAPTTGREIGEVKITTSFDSPVDDGTVVTTTRSDGATQVTILYIQRPIDISGATVAATGTESVADTRVWTEGLTLYIRTDSPTNAYIYDMSGALIKTLSAVGTISAVLPEGTYVVKMDNAATKILIKK